MVVEKLVNMQEKFYKITAEKLCNVNNILVIAVLQMWKQ